MVKSILEVLTAARPLNAAFKRELHEEMRNSIGFGGLKPIRRMFV